MGDETWDFNKDRVYLGRPTNFIETVAHLLKGSLGIGILGMPMAIYWSGLWNGLILTPIIGFILTYCCHLVVKNAQILYVRKKIPQLLYDEVGEKALEFGPEPMRKYKMIIKCSINTLLIIDLFGCCTVYTVLIAKSIKQIVDQYSDTDLSVRIYILLLTPFLLFYIMIRTLKFLAPMSILSDLLIFAGIILVLYYTFQDLPSPKDYPFFGTPVHISMYFGIVIFALEGIGVVMPLENNMIGAERFSGLPISVLCLGMSIVVILYTIVGFFGYLKYGDAIQGSITLNIPENEWLGQGIKLIFGIAMFHTFALQFYVPFQICWRPHKEKFGKWNHLVEYGFRWAIVIIILIPAIIVPKIGCVMSLIGAICLSFLGLIFPAIIDLCVCWEDPGLGKYKWRIFVDSFLIFFGIVGFVCGTIASIMEIIETFKEDMLN